MTTKKDDKKAVKKSPERKRATGATAHVRNKNRAARQEALRESLSSQGHLQYVIQNIDKLSELNTELDPTEVNRLKIASEMRLKLINKYLPDLKSVENTIETSEGKGKITFSWEK